MKNARIDFLLAYVRRRIIEKYIGSAFLLMWIFLVPLIPILTSLLIFYYIANVPQVREMGLLGYTVFIYTGLLPYQTFQTSLVDSSGLIINNMEILKSTLFPTHFLGLSSLGVVMFEFVLQLGVLLTLLLIAGADFLTPKLLLLPVAVFCLLAMTLGLGWLVSVIGYFVRDIQAALSLAFVGAVYITPTMYPVETTTGLIRTVILVNPLTHMVIVFRDVLTPAGDLQTLSWIYFPIFALIVLLAGYLAIRRFSRIGGDLV